MTLLIDHYQQLIESKRQVMKYSELRELNRGYRNIVPNKTHPSFTLIYTSCLNVLGKLTYEQIRHFRSISQLDELLEQVINTIGRELDGSVAQAFGISDKAHPTFRAHLNFVHELVVYAMKHEELFRDYRAPGLSHFEFRIVAYDLHLAMFKIESRHEQKEANRQSDEVVDQYCEERQGNLSVDHRKEYHEHLAPAEKVRVLKRAVEKYNEIGHLITHDFNGSRYSLAEKDVVTLAKKDLAYAKTFFEQNREATVEEIMRILEMCVDLDLRHPKSANEAWDHHWHVRRARSVGFLLRHLDKIADKLDHPLGFVFQRT